MKTKQIRLNENGIKFIEEISSKTGMSDTKSAEKALEKFLEALNKNNYDINKIKI